MTMMAKIKLPGLLAALLLGSLPVVASEFYYALQANAATPLPSQPTSLLIQAPSFFEVKVGATLKVHLLRGDTVVGTSKLSFSQAKNQSAFFQPVPFAAFLPLGVTATAGDPLEGATLLPGNADLSALAAAPGQYQLLWELSAGSSMANPRVCILTGATAGLLDLKLVAVAARQQEEAQRLGSVLFFNYYVSDASNPGVLNTTLSLTNTNPAATAYFKLFFVNGSTCESYALCFSLPPQQSLNLLASDLDPGSKGYVIAVATNQAGQPTRFNWLIGQAVVKQRLDRGSYSTTLPAIVVRKNSEGEAPLNGGAAELSFNDEMYDRLPRQLAFDNVPNQANSLNRTTFVLYRPLSDLAAPGSSVSVQVTGWSTDGNNQLVTSNLTTPLTVSCFREIAGIAAGLRLGPVAVNALTANGRAWFTAAAADQLPLLGVQFTTGSAFSTGGNARPLNFSLDYKLRVPLAVSCP